MKQDLLAQTVQKAHVVLGAIRVMLDRRVYRVYRVKWAYRGCRVNRDRVVLVFRAIKEKTERLGLEALGAIPDRAVCKARMGF